MSQCDSGKIAGNVVVLSCVGFLAACSEFNMVPPCAGVGDEVALALIPNSVVGPNGTLNKEKLKNIVGIENLVETNHGYNTRTCRGDLLFKPTQERVLIQFRLEQAEGVRSWQNVTFIDPDEPQFHAMIQKIQKSYAVDSP